MDSKSPFKKGSHSSDGGSEDGTDFSDLFKQAKNFLQAHASSQQSQAAAGSGEYAGAQQGGAPAPAYQGNYQGGASAPAGSNKTDYKHVYGSAQTLFEGIQAKVGGKASNVDNHQLAEAAADMLKAANHAGFVKDSQYGQYFEKAENYLHKYGTKQQKQDVAAAAAANPGAPPGDAPGAPPSGYPPAGYPPAGYPPRE